jgi:hypothetical protein
VTRSNRTLISTGRIAVAGLSALALALGMVSLLTATGASGAKKKTRSVERQTTIEFTDLPGSSGDRISGQVQLGARPEGPEECSPLPCEPLMARASALTPSRCLKGQRVEIRQHYTGEGGGSVPGSEPTLVATATTDASGAWQTTAYEASGANRNLFDVLTAGVPYRAYKKGSKRLICLKASETRTVFSN